MHIVTRVLGQVMARFTAVYLLMENLLLQLASNLRVSCTQVYQNVEHLYRNQLAKVKQSIEHLVARLIIAARLTKVEIMIAILNLGAHGRQLVTTVRQIPQRVLSLLKRGR